MKEIMERYITTFFECVQEWPDDIKADIYRLYAYLRAMDEIVEHNVFHPEWRKICEEFEKLEEEYLNNLIFNFIIKFLYKYLK